MSTCVNSTPKEAQRKNRSTKHTFAKRNVYQVEARRVREKGITRQVGENASPRMVCHRRGKMGFPNITLQRREVGQKKRLTG